MTLRELASCKNELKEIETKLTRLRNMLGSNIQHISDGTSIGVKVPLTGKFHIAIMQEIQWLKNRQNKLESIFRIHGVDNE